MGLLVNIVIAVIAGVLIMRFGLKLLAGFAAPMEEPPPPGELRKVKIMYRCELCGSEVRMTIAPDEDPEAPRHCMGEMTIVAPIE